MLLLPTCVPVPTGSAPTEPPSPSLSAAPTPGTSAAAPVARPFVTPADCAVTPIAEREWRLDCGEERNRNARGTLGPGLMGQGWRLCASGLASATWAKGEVQVVIAEGSGAPGEGFIVRADRITTDCALAVSTADPTRLFEVMATSFVGQDLAFVAARWTDGRALFRTRDGGRTWEENALPAEINYVAGLRFVDERNGWLIGFAPRGGQYGCDHAAPPDVPRCREILFRSRDGGRTWTSLRVTAIAPAGGSALKELQFVDATNGWMLERSGPLPCQTGKPCFNLLATADGGDAWRTVLADTALSDLHFIDRLHGWARVPHDDQEGTIDLTATADGGATWHRQIAGEQVWGISVPRVDVAIALAGDGYCTASLCGRYGLFRIVGGDLETVHETSTTGWWAAPGCGGFLGEPAFVDALHGWIGLQPGVGGLSGFNPAGLIATVDGGQTWSCAPGLPRENVDSVWFSDRSHGWVTTRSHSGSAGIGGARIWRTDDGGKSWRVVLN